MPNNEWALTFFLSANGPAVVTVDVGAVVAVVVVVVCMSHFFFK